MNASFAQFTTPEKNEGFDEIRYEWSKADKAAEYMKARVKTMKLNIRLDSLKPGQFFKDKTAEFRKSFQEWQDKQKSWKQSSKKDDDDDEADLDTVDNVLDAGNGIPLFANFAYEDWTMLQTRFEFWALTVSFIKDLDDPDRPGVPYKDILFYYSRYFNKQISPKQFAAKDLDEVLNMIKDTVALNADKLLVASLDDNESIIKFVKLTESVRRARQRRIDGGDETARLVFPPPEVQRPGGYGSGPAGVSGLRHTPPSSDEPRKVPPRGDGLVGPSGKGMDGKGKSGKSKVKGK